MTTLIDYFLILEFNKRNKLDVSNKKTLFKRYSKFRKKIERVEAYCSP